MTASLRGGMGTYLIPDHNGDGIEDILAVVVSDAHAHPVAAVISARDGLVIGTNYGLFSEVFEMAVAGKYVVVPEDVDLSGQVEADDVVAVISGIDAGNMEADVNQDGILGVQDYQASLNAHVTDKQVGDPIPSSQDDDYLGALVLVGDRLASNLCADDPVIIVDDWTSVDPWSGGGGPVVLETVATEPCGDNGIDCDTCDTYTPSPSYGLPILLGPGCNDPRILEALADPRIQGAIQAAQLSCALAAGDAGGPACWGQIRITCDAQSDNPISIDTRMPPSIGIDPDFFSPGDNGREEMVNALAHEITHAAQLCSDPDTFYAGKNNAICAELEAYCAEPGNANNCDGDPADACGLACLSAQDKWGPFCFGDPYERCVSRCEDIADDCDNGFYSP